MANEISLNVSGSLVNGNLTDSIPLLQPQLSVNQATADKFERIFTVTTSDSALSITITVLGYAYFRNLDVTNYLDLGPDNGSGAIAKMIRLKPGEISLLRLTPGMTLRGQAHTASCLLQAKIWNDLLPASPMLPTLAVGSSQINRWTGVPDRAFSGDFAPIAIGETYTIHWALGPVSVGTVWSPTWPVTTVSDPAVPPGFYSWASNFFWIDDDSAAGTVTVTIGGISGTQPFGVGSVSLSSGGILTGGGGGNITTTVTNNTDHIIWVSQQFVESVSYLDVTTYNTTATLGDALFDIAILEGGTSPTGFIQFDCYGPNDSTCGLASAFTDLVPVSGNGNYVSGGFTPLVPGTYRWIANYLGDSNNNPTSNVCNESNESILIPGATARRGWVAVLE